MSEDRDLRVRGMKRRSFLGLLGLVVGASCGLRPQPLATGGIVEPGPYRLPVDPIYCQIRPDFGVWVNAPTLPPLRYVVRLPDMVDVYQWPEGKL